MSHGRWPRAARGAVSRSPGRGDAPALPAVAVPIIVALVALVAVDPRPLQAQAAAEDEASIEELRRTVRELERAVGERDAAIADLLRRTEGLERRLAAVTPPEQAPPPAQPMPPLGAPEAPVGPEPPAPPGGDTEDAIAAEEATPPSVPGRVEVDEEAVATALERALVQEGALLLPPGVVQAEPGFTFSREEASALRFDGQQAVSVSRVRQNSLTFSQSLRLGLPFDAQLALDLPYRYEEEETITTGGGLAGVREESRDGAGFGDLSVGLSKGLLHERGWRPDLITGVTWNTDTGQTDDGVTLGSGFHEVTAAVTASKSQDPLVFVGGLSYRHSFEQDGFQPGDAVGLSLGAVLAASPETSLRFFLGQRVFFEDEIDGREMPGSDDVVGLFSIGASSLLTSRALLDVELGIGLTDGAPDYTIGISLPVRFDLPFRF